MTERHDGGSLEMCASNCSSLSIGDTVHVVTALGDGPSAAGPGVLPESGADEFMVAMTVSEAR